MISGVATRKRRLRHAALVAVGLLLFAGCEESLGRPPLPPTAPSAVTACLTATGQLLTDVNNDGRPDLVADPSRSGARLTITFGAGSARETTVGARGLADRAGEHQQYVRVAVADFDGDGWTDLVVVAGAEQRGDDPIPPKLSELRLGPFSDTGRGQRILHLDTGPTKDIGVTDSNHDRFPDLAAYTYSGDGVHETRVRLGDSAAALGAQAEPTGHDDAADPPRTGLEPFYPRCVAGAPAEAPSTA